MQIQVLGGLAVRLGSQALSPGTPKQQTVLAMLACNAGQLVSVEQLVDELWLEDPPPSAIPNVRTYAANLRRSLEAMLPDREVLIRSRDGYRLDVECSDVDLCAFRAEVAEARQLLGADEREAVRLVSRALARWRGPMLTGIALGSRLSAQVAAATEDRLLATELYADLQIRLGRYDEALPVLRELLIRHPLREPAHLLLMQALHVGGDSAGAVAAYTAAGRILRQQLNVEPGEELQRLYRRIARPDGQSRRVDTAGAPGREPSVAVDRKQRLLSHLPRTVPDFVGRADAVEHLLSTTLRAGEHNCAVNLVDGMAGSGKTTLAVHVANRLTDRFPDAQLFIDLKGHDPAEKLDSATALATLLRQLGTPAGRIPSDPGDRLDRWRRDLAGRRVIIVLDNAADAAQIRPLLPTVPGNLVIVTSRRRINGLDVDPPVSLPLLKPAEGVALLASTAGAERVAAEPEAAVAVVESCGHLPLAIRLAGSRLAHRPNWQVADLAKLLATKARRLDHLTSGDRSVAGAFAASYAALNEPAQRLFRLLSVHPGDEFGLLAASALSGLPLDDTADVLDALLDSHLIEELTAGRYRMHDLIRHYAHDLSNRVDQVNERRLAVADLLDLMLHLTFSVAEILELGRIRLHVSLDAPRRPDLVEMKSDSAEKWMEIERANLVLLVGTAREWELRQEAWRLARILWRFLYTRGCYDDIVVTSLKGLSAAEEIGDERAVAVMHNYLASAYLRTGNYPGALTHLKKAVEICERCGDRSNLARYQANLVAVYWLLGEPDKAVAVALERMRNQIVPDAHETATHLPNLGLAMALLGRYDEALRAHRLHLYLGRQLGSQFHILNALGHIGAVKCRMGQYDVAARALRTALVMRQRTGHRYAEPEVRNDLGIALRGLGRITEAVLEHEAARKMAVDAGEPHVEAAALNDLALTLGGSAGAARLIELHREALRVATRIAHPYEQGRALTGLAEHMWSIDPAEARRHWTRALAIFRRMGVPERFDVARRLAEAEAQDPPGKEPSTPGPRAVPSPAHRS
ncbi:AfsR/SARP family transcriptional regulator [Micromonospora sediminimaris]|uniref:SARP family transcriptional regulator n=1 Tax=Micromonospora sediminimaris TaxID=547162 RepID=A0A9W5USF5_9ACTN|nr:BTAD domain-containing putative transcriptional regulator [Micromonospora sediminimaris]GIJ33790.1 SARP family transcriptional regulator [Micromonospora sediminimaris]SFD48494.1 DNA-binding transcriptional activator of the SARP family [Micromonospora sediminimaris]